MARFSDAPQHTRRRALLEELLPDANGLQDFACRRTGAAARSRAGRWDVMPLALAVPVAVLAGALGVPEPEVAQVVALTGRLCEELAPTLSPALPTTGGDEAARDLTALLARVGPWDPEEVAAIAGLLFQARDPTAALVGITLLDGKPVGTSDADVDIAALVEGALRHHAPVQYTRRVALADLQIGGVRVPRGAVVWLALADAASERASQPATFGVGPHGCPGSAHAGALARGVLAGLRLAGWWTVAGQEARYDPRPNLRMPAAVLVERV